MTDAAKALEALEWLDDVKISPKPAENICPKCKDPDFRFLTCSNEKGFYGFTCAYSRCGQELSINSRDHIKETIRHALRILANKDDKLCVVKWGEQAPIKLSGNTTMENCTINAATSRIQGAEKGVAEDVRNALQEALKVMCWFHSGENLPSRETIAPKIDAIRKALSHAAQEGE